MDSNAVLMSILSKLQEKHKLLNQIFEVTKGLECVSLDDEMSISSFLSIRQTAMNSIDKAGAEIKELLVLLPIALRNKTEKLISQEGEPAIPDNPVEINIFDVSKNNMSLLKRIIEADIRFNNNIKKRLNA